MPIRSPFPDVDVPNISVWEFLFERSSRPYPDDKVIYRDASTYRAHTYSQVKDLATSFGAALKARWHWQKGDVLAIVSPNCIDVPPVIWGVLRVGGIVSPMNPASTVSELANLLKDCGAKGVVTQKCCLDTVLQAAQKIGFPLERILLINDEKDDQGRIAHFENMVQPMTAALFGASERHRPEKINPKKDIAFLVYSSGTTGLPKGVMLSHENIVSNALMIQATEGPPVSHETDKVIAFLPFFHIYGISLLIHQPFYSGTETLVMPRFDLPHFLSTIQTSRITIAFVVPPVVLLLAKHPLVSSYNLKSLRMVLSAAAPLTKDLMVTFHSRLQIPIKQGYGLSETSPGTCLQPWEGWETAMGSVGVLLPNQTVKIVDPDDKEVGEGEVGEIWVKGPNVFKGYLKNEEQTRACMTEDGYYKTGDIGFMDGKGNFYITDRVKELIKYKGFQVAPAQLEGYLLGHPDVDDVAVIGVYEPEQATEVPRAYVVLRKAVEAGREKEKEIVNWLAERVSGHKRLRGGVRFVESVPKSATGKILRRVLKEEVARERGAKL